METPAFQDRASADMPNASAPPSPPARGEREYALHFSEDNAPVAQKSEVRPLGLSEAENPFFEETVGVCRVFIWRADALNACVGVETEAGSFFLLASGAMYDNGYEISAFSGTLGASGIRVIVPEGTAAVMTYYYTLENGMPALLAFANNAAEYDLDGDGDKELICRMITNPPTCWIAKSADGAVVWSEDMHLLTGANGGVEYDPGKNAFTAQWYEPGEGGDVKDRVFGEYAYESGRLILLG
ncbi:MAG: hypothetical protein LLF87_00945 [Eubacteriales bacterium]|nr:hypothetical protein [Eubacteriales bacterium]